MHIGRLYARVRFKERYENHVRNICTTVAVTFLLLRREASTVKKKCHIILLYGDAARRSLRNLSSYTADYGLQARLGGRGYRLYGIVGVTEPGLPEHRGRIANRVRFFARRRYIRAGCVRTPLPHTARDSMRWNLSRVNRYDVMATGEDAPEKDIPYSVCATRRG